MLLAGTDPVTLSRAGVRWLVVEAGTPGDMGAAARTIDRLTVTYAGRDLTLYRVGGETPGMPAARLVATVIAHLAWLAMLTGSAIGMAVAGWRTRAGRQRSPATVATPPR
jgi:hypothetical protein